MVKLLRLLICLRICWSVSAVFAQQPVKPVVTDTGNHVKPQHKLKEVSVQGKTASKALQDSPLPVQVIDLRKVHGQSGNLVELLNRVPGVKLRTDGAVGDPVNINLNGLSGKAIVMFKDGIPLNFYGHSFQPSLIPSNMLDRVEVYKGALPVSLGADALGGAINFISRYPKQKTLEFSYEVGSFNTHRATLSAYLPMSNGWYMGLNGAYTHSDNSYKRDVGRYADENQQTELIFDNSVRRPFRNNALTSPLAELYGGLKHLSWTDDLRLTLIGSRYYREITQLPGVPSNVGNHTALFPFTDDRTFSQLLHYEKSFFSKRLKADLVLGHSYSKTNFTDTSKNIYNRLGELVGRKDVLTGELSNRGNDLRLKYNFYTVRFNVSYELAKDHQLQFNHIYTHNRRKGTDTLGGLAKESTVDVYETPALYTKNITALGLRSRFLGERLEHLIAVKRYQMKTSGYSTFGLIGNEHLASDSSNTWGWMDGISFRLHPRWMVKASYEYATRMPDDFEVFGDAYSVKSNFGIRPERSHNYSLQFQYTGGIQEQAGAFNAAINLFSRRTSARIMLTRDIPYSYYKNRSIVTSKGVELDLSYQPFRFLQFSANGTYMDVKEDISPELKGQGQKPFKIADLPPLLGNVQVRLLFDNLLQQKSRTEFYGYWNYTHRFNFLGIDEDRLGLFERFPKDYQNAIFWIPNDGRLGQQSYTAGIIHYLSKPKCSIALECNNLANAKLFDNYFMQRPGRAFSLKLRWELTSTMNK